MHKLYLEYRESLKDIAVEEMVDLVFFRPLAFLIVKIIYRLPVTPNQVSFLSMLTGITAGVFFARGSQKDFIYGGILYALAHILDCCDGMIARLKKNGTPMGRIIDGWTDYITGTAVFLGLFIGLQRGDLSFSLIEAFLLMLPASVSLIVHSMIVDFYRHEFLAHGLGKVSSILDDREMFAQYLEQLKKEKRNYFEILLLTFYMYYTKTQLKRETVRREYPQDVYYRLNRPLVFMWNWIGAATHIFVTVIAAVLFMPELFFIYVLGLSNLWMLGMVVVQVKTNRAIRLR